MTVFSTEITILSRLLYTVNKIGYWCFFRSYYKRSFKAYGDGIGWGRLFSPLIPRSIKIACPENISIGDGCQFDEYTQLIATPYSRLIIGKGVRFSNGFAHVTASFDTIEIEDDCLFGALVLIINGNHGYQDIRTPIKYQESYSTGPILIKAGSWIGRGACIMGGVTIGKNSVVGASSVVTKSIPDYCLAAGNPAKVIKKYNFEGKAWEKIV
jgi:acetyltransferase-like isoleucine patch superfamily enzyme